MDQESVNNGDNDEALDNSDDENASVCSEHWVFSDDVCYNRPSVNCCKESAGAPHRLSSFASISDSSDSTSDTHKEFSAGIHLAKRFADRVHVGSRRLQDNQVIYDKTNVRDRLVLTLADVYREYVFARSQLRLRMNSSAVHQQMQVSPVHLINSLCDSALYEDVLAIVDAFHMNPEIFVTDRIAARCSTIAQALVSTHQNLTDSTICIGSLPGLQNGSLPPLIIERLAVIQTIASLSLSTSPFSRTKDYSTNSTFELSSCQLETYGKNFTLLEYVIAVLSYP
ncbi:unnamed protein product [Protopolystoma xenopodis]|uniref:Uncharacterized protein n=1 Tax=Protopolystoma xenopodis TaxID=117903 RepID=A0A448X4Z7_9PLAT|nr:unnamed protein product [Protopolystoma xenopodis]